MMVNFMGTRMENGPYRRSGQRWALLWVGVFLVAVVTVILARLLVQPVGYPWYPFGFGWIWIPFAFFFLLFVLRWFFLPWGWGYPRGYRMGDDTYSIQREVRSGRDHQGAVRADVARLARARTGMRANLSTRVLLLATLELIVGGVVVLGGAALISFSVDAMGKALGIVHAILGLMGLSAGVLLLAKKGMVWTLTVWTNVLIIVFSTASEVALFGAGSLPSDQFVDSITGTTVAVVIAVVVIVLLMKHDLKVFLRKR